MGLAEKFSASPICFPAMSEDDPLRYIYNFKCANCRYSRRLGHARLSAETLATSHALRLAHHVTVWKSDLASLTSEIVLEMDPQRDNPKLTDQPPF